MGLHIPLEGFDQKISPLNRREVRLVTMQLLKAGEGLVGPSSNVRPIIMTPEPREGERDSRLEEYRESIHRDYEGVVLTNEIHPDPPLEVPMGMRPYPSRRGRSR